MATISKLPSGKWRVQVRRQGVYRASTFDRKRQAQDWASSIESQIGELSARGKISPKNITLSHLIELYVEKVGEGSSTQRNCVNRIKVRLGSHTLASLSSIHVRDFIDGRQADGVKGVTIAQDLSYLQSILDWGKHDRRLDVDPEIARDGRRALKYRKLTTKSHCRTRLPTDAELEQLKRHWAKGWSRIPMALLVEFAIASAMRLGEICRIRAEDVDLAGRSVIVRDRKHPRKKIGNHEIVPLVPDAWAMVCDRLKEVSRGPLFPYRSQSVSAAFARACKETGIVDLHFHDMRHLGTVKLFRMGLDIPRVAMITGHKDWGNLRRYTNLDASDVHSVLD